MEEKEGKGKQAVPQMEEEILRFWAENKIFEKSLERNKSGKNFVFYDGPPFATGLPHYGHLLAGTIKDVIPRYQTMKGRYVRRKWGWDCHGLPIENLIEGELGLKNKKDIETLGVEKFNQAAKDSVLRYDSDWKKIVPRMGRWIDMENSYKTMDPEYTESIWWAFKTLYDKGLVYEGYKSMHICPRCETTLANTEVSLGYKDITDISVVAKFEMADEPNTFFLAWTTTPWTLPGNVALAINPDILYVKIGNGDSKYILAKDRLEILKDEKYEVFEEIEGRDLVGKKYKPIFDYYTNTSLENSENGWRVYGADFVDTESGTGIVHIAPAFGEDDMDLGKKNDLPFIQHVGMDGKFKEDVTDFSGHSVKPKDNHQSGDVEIIKNLAKRNLLFSKEKISHSYPHCWRCDTPLLNYAASSWFVKVVALKDKLVEINKDINWVPGYLKDGRFGKWLEGARDWAVSRSRYWGAPIPVWKSDGGDKLEVIGSVSELKEKIKKSGNKYFVMRHGEADHNIEQVVSVKYDYPHHLTNKGKKQAEDATKSVSENVDLIFSSDFVRAKETAEIVATELGVSKDNIIFDKRLREVDAGEFHLRPIKEYRDYFSSQEEKFYKKTPGGEDLTEMKNRLMDFLYETENNYQNKNILIITHEYGGWLLEAGSQGADPKKASAIKTEDDFIKTGEVRELLFVPLPHNQNYELDFHRPYIDRVSFDDDKGGRFVRVPEVFDCWFESGSMPYAQTNYPFGDKKEFKNNFPADFIAEGLDQTRGWFYNMLVLSVGLFNESPYKNVIVNGLVLAEDGQKMSKRLKNYPDPLDVVGKYGADALRYYMLSSPVVKGEDLNFSEKGVDEVYKKIILRLLNVLSFYKLYEDGGIEASNKSTNTLDRWAIARLGGLVGDIETNMEKYELDKTVKPIGEFVDDLSTWYLRRSRDRFKSGDKKEALETTKFVLLEFSKAIAPFMPFVSEHIYRQVGGGKESVHLEDYPALDKKLLKSGVIEEMKGVREVVSLALEARMNAGLKVRQPLLSLKIKNNDSKFAKDNDLLDIIKDEVNVKEVLFDKTTSEGIWLDTNITPELKKEGIVRDFIRHIQDMRKQMGLTPGDYVDMSIKTDNEGKDLLDQFADKIKSQAKAKSIIFTEAELGKEIVIGDISFGIEINL